jgi:hypothetical protein
MHRSLPLPCPSNTLGGCQALLRFLSRKAPRDDGPCWHDRRPSGLTCLPSGDPLSFHQQPPRRLQGHGAARLQHLGEALRKADHGLRRVQGSYELGVIVAQIPDDLAAGLDGEPLGAPLVLETEETIEAGAGEDRGGEERPLAVVEDRSWDVAGGQARPGGGPPSRGWGSGRRSTGRRRRPGPRSAVRPAGRDRRGTRG